jgi:uncharacterized membrane protein YedE/YeeE
MSLTEWLHAPWPWYVAGPLAGLMVPFLLILGNKYFGISSSLRHICAACFPSNIDFFKYNWKKESWNLFFVTGIMLGGVVTAVWLKDPDPVAVHTNLVHSLREDGIQDFRHLVPVEIFNWSNLFSIQGALLMIAGGFLVGFGTRYAGGCTSGHSIMGLANLQWPSLIATIFFMIGGFISANLLVPFILKL